MTRFIRHQSNNVTCRPWHGDWAAWGGLAAKVTDKATINAQLAYEFEGTVAAALNVAYVLVPGFTVTPELDYTKFDGARKNKRLKAAATTHSAVSSASSAISDRCIA